MGKLPKGSDTKLKGLKCCDHRCYSATFLGLLAMFTLLYAKGGAMLSHKYRQRIIIFENWGFRMDGKIMVANLGSGIEKRHEDIFPYVIGRVNMIAGIPLANYKGGKGQGTHLIGDTTALDDEISLVGFGPDVGIYAVKVIDDHGFRA